MTTGDIPDTDRGPAHEATWLVCLTNSGSFAVFVDWMIDVEVGWGIEATGYFYIGTLKYELEDVDPGEDFATDWVIRAVLTRDDEHVEIELDPVDATNF